MEDEYEEGEDDVEEEEDVEGDDDVEMLSGIETGETEEEIELDDVPRRRHGQIETYEVDSIIQRKFENVKCPEVVVIFLYN